ncbi:hypothetical protein BESB_037630 [Besnoitia besnoiti]|uniref:Tetratricopeptide repeat-containing protein n=1 Tax=Besnoitia besnoiti TaxID=94643 RepID=A0A2A9MH56_BESBE|nr:hypothetical protein BESB_037630 [Besnoitia besnoiti]PFH37305.1 hypothetical protein BESB_037630 [Besnoitia besnoiti]
MESDLESGSDLPPELNFNSDDEPPCPRAGDVAFVSPQGDVRKTILSLGQGHMQAGFGDEICVRWRQVPSRAVAGTPKDIESLLMLLEGSEPQWTTLGESDSFPQLLSLAARHMRPGEIALVSGPSTHLRQPQKYLYSPAALAAAAGSSESAASFASASPPSSSLASSYAVFHKRTLVHRRRALRALRASQSPAEGTPPGQLSSGLAGPSVSAPAEDQAGRSPLASSLFRSPSCDASRGQCPSLGGDARPSPACAAAAAASPPAVPPVRSCSLALPLAAQEEGLGQAFCRSRAPVAVSGDSGRADTQPPSSRHALARAGASRSSAGSLSSSKAFAAEEEGAEHQKEAEGRAACSPAAADMREEEACGESRAHVENGAGDDCAVVLQLISIQPIRMLTEDRGVRMRPLRPGIGWRTPGRNDVVSFSFAILCKNADCRAKQLGAICALADQAKQAAKTGEGDAEAPNASERTLVTTRGEGAGFAHCTGGKRKEVGSVTLESHNAAKADNLERERKTFAAPSQTCVELGSQAAVPSCESRAGLGCCEGAPERSALVTARGDGDGKNAEICLSRTFADRLFGSPRLSRHDGGGSFFSSASRWSSSLSATLSASASFEAEGREGDGDRRAGMATEEVAFSDIPLRGVQTALRHMKEGEEVVLTLAGAHAEWESRGPFKPANWLCACCGLSAPCREAGVRTGQTAQCEKPEKRVHTPQETEGDRKGADAEDGTREGKPGIGEEGNKEGAEEAGSKKTNKPEDKGPTGRLGACCCVPRGACACCASDCSGSRDGKDSNSESGVHSAELHAYIKLNSWRPRATVSVPSPVTASEILGSFAFTSLAGPLDERRRAFIREGDRSANSRSSALLAPLNWRPEEGSTVVLFLSLALWPCAASLSHARVPLPLPVTYPEAPACGTRAPAAQPGAAGTEGSRSESEEAEERPEEEGTWLLFTVGDWSAPLWLEEAVKRLKLGEVGRFELDPSLFAHAAQTLPYNTGAYCPPSSLAASSCATSLPAPPVSGEQRRACDWGGLWVIRPPRPASAPSVSRCGASLASSAVPSFAEAWGARSESLAHAASFAERCVRAKVEAGELEAVVQCIRRLEKAGRACSSESRAGEDAAGVEVSETPSSVVRVEWEAAPAVERLLAEVQPDASLGVGGGAGSEATAEGKDEAGERGEYARGEDAHVVATVWLASILDRRKDLWARGSAEEKRQLIEQFKKEGNLCLKRGWLSAASQRYARAFDVCRFLPAYEEATRLQPLLLAHAAERPASGAYPSASPASCSTHPSSTRAEREPEAASGVADRQGAASPHSSSGAASPFSGRAGDSGGSAAASEPPTDDPELTLLELSRLAGSVLNNWALCCLKQNLWRAALRHADVCLFLLEIGEQALEAEGEKRQHEADTDQARATQELRADAPHARHVQRDAEGTTVVETSSPGHGEDGASADAGRCREADERGKGQRKNGGDGGEAADGSFFRHARCVALYRKAKALSEGGELSEAIKTAKAAALLEPADSSVQALLKAIQRRRAHEIHAERSAFLGMFSRPKTKEGGSPYGMRAPDNRYLTGFRWRKQSQFSTPLELGVNILMASAVQYSIEEARYEPICCRGQDKSNMGRFRSFTSYTFVGASNVDVRDFGDRFEKIRIICL